MRLIDVNVLKEWVKNWFAKNRLYHPYAKDNNIPIPELYDILERMPTIEERKKGKWEHGEELSREYIGDCITAIFYNGWKCSACGCCVEEEREPLYKFCPNCGADMRGEQE